ncbi:MAG TPA: ATP-binding protein [Phycisphaerae bacterium]|nr:ATP-binding protein [Phycisphaerae bacterium]
MSALSQQKDLLELELPSDPRFLAEVRRPLRDWSLQHRWTAQQAAKIALAVDEAITNIIRHAYKCDPNNRILLTVRAIRKPSEGVEIRLRDFGQFCNPEQIQGRALEDIRPGGLGVHIIRAMMDFVEYAPAPGGGTLLIMRKFRASKAAKPEVAKNAEPRKRSANQ